ncbi:MULTISPECIES: BrnA antitoxin family protein [Falsihalocynthiibacter]|uniref:BrnA antitoxin family protein n=1 Tax=Falsihalocynthiibacter TaxID=2854182 RepID=UPI003002D54F
MRPQVCAGVNDLVGGWGHILHKMEAAMVTPHNKNTRDRIEPASDRRATKEQHRHVRMAKNTLARVSTAVRAAELRREFIPEDWEEISEAFGFTPRNARVTLLLEEPVLKYYRAYGAGYQKVMNDVLALFAELRLSKVIEAREDRDEEGRAV